MALQASTLESLLSIPYGLLPPGMKSCAWDKPGADQRFWVIYQKAMWPTVYQTQSAHSKSCKHCCVQQLMSCDRSLDRLTEHSWLALRLTSFMVELEVKKLDKLFQEPDVYLSDSQIVRWLLTLNSNSKHSHSTMVRLGKTFAAAVAGVQSERATKLALRAAREIRDSGSGWNTYIGLALAELAEKQPEIKNEVFDGILHSLVSEKAQSDADTIHFCVLLARLADGGSRELVLRAAQSIILYMGADFLGSASLETLEKLAPQIPDAVIKKQYLALCQELNTAS